MTPTPAQADERLPDEAWTRAMNAALTYRNLDPEAMDEQDAWADLVNAIGALRDYGDREARHAAVPAATLRHDAGAIAQCFYCRRYSLDPRTLSDRQPACECGKKDGWSGSFSRPQPDSRWSGSAPSLPVAGEEQP